MPNLDKRKKIVQASEKLFAGRRFHEVKLDDVAREAGVAKGTIYLYFSSKDDLFIETIATGFDDMLKSLKQDASPDETSFRDRLLRACESITEFHRDRRPLWHTIHGDPGILAGQRGRLKEIWLSFQQELVTVIGSIFSQGIENGYIRDGLSPELMAVCLLGMLRGRRRFAEHLQPQDQELSAFLDVFLNGIEAHNAAGAHRVS